jgi:hypothetical protein
VSEFEDTLNKLLSSPEEMEKIAGLAKSLSSSVGTEGAGGEASAGAPSSPLAGLDPKLLGMLGRLMGEYKSGAGDNTALLGALRPYLKESQRGKLDRASEISKLARIAKLAMSEFSEGGP